LIHSDVSAVELLAVHFSDGFQHGLLISESHEAETPRPSCFAVRNDLALCHLAEGTEGTLQSAVISSPSKATHEAPVLRLSHFFQRKGKKKKKTTQLLL
jgi:hypothetical protein